jgi:hypothetical protein
MDNKDSQLNLPDEYDEDNGNHQFPWIGAAIYPC